MSSKLDELDDYVNGLLADPDAFEAELFEAAQAGAVPETQFLQRLTHDLGWLAKRGQLVSRHTRETIAALRASAERIHYADLGPGGRVDLPLWAADVERVIFHLRVDVRGYEQVEIQATRPDGQPVITFRDVQCDPGDGAVYGVCMEPLARISIGSSELHWRITGQRAGRRELIGTYETRPVP